MKRRPFFGSSSVEAGLEPTAVVRTTCSYAISSPMIAALIRLSSGATDLQFHVLQRMHFEPIETLLGSKVAGQGCVSTRPCRPLWGAVHGH